MKKVLFILLVVSLLLIPMASAHCVDYGLVQMGTVNYPETITFVANDQKANATTMCAGHGGICEGTGDCYSGAAYAFGPGIYTGWNWNTVDFPWLDSHMNATDAVSALAYCQDGTYNPTMACWDLSLAPAPADPVCSFVALPNTGPHPLSVNITDTTVTNPTARVWNVTNSTGSVILSSTAETWIADIPNVGSYTATLWAANASGVCTVSHALTSTNPGNVIIDLDIKDASTGNLIQGVNVGIYDYVHAVWRNTTAPTGMVYFDSTGPAFQYPLYVGQTVRVAGWGPGYAVQYKDIPIQFETQWVVPHQAVLSLIRNASLPATGNATVQVNVVSNADSSAMNNVMVQLESIIMMYGVTKYTTGGGTAVFENIPAGDYQLSAVRMGYNEVTMSITAPASVVTTVDISLVPLGATPTPTGTVTPGPGGTTPAPGTTPDTRTDAEKDSDMMGLIRDYGDELILLAILMTIIGLIKMGLK